VHHSLVVKVMRHTQLRRGKRKIQKTVASAIMLTLLITGALTLVLNTQPAETELKTRYANADQPTDYSNLQGKTTATSRLDISQALMKHGSLPTFRSLFEDESDTRLMDFFQLSFEANGKQGFSNEVDWDDFAYADNDSAELVIGLSDTQPDSYSELADLIACNGGELVNKVSVDGKVTAVVADMSYEAMRILVSDAEISRLASYVEPNFRFEVDFVPNDADWLKQWGPQRIEADYAWNTTIGDHSVLVAVVDTGIDWNHPDLAANYVTSGYDWANNDPDPMDDHGHGTHVAGTIAAVINNGIGIAGLAQVRIMAEKVLDEEGSGRLSEIAQGIVHAVNQGAKIINLSLGASIKSKLLHEAVKYAYDHDVLVVAAAGNDATSEKHYPAAFEEAVAVSATDELDKPATFTNYGDWVDVAAPGVHIYSTFWDDSYVYASGTSMASPHVAGVAALIWSQFPYMTRDQVRAQLQCYSDDLGEPGFDVYYGYGRVNAKKAVEQAPSNHDVLVLNLKTPSYVRLEKEVSINATILNMGTNNESDIIIQLLVNGSVVSSTLIDFLKSGTSATLSFTWTAMVEGIFNVTSYIMPVADEAIVGNNALTKQIRVRVPQFIRVPDEYGTIQKAIDAAFEGDTIFVASGTYYESVWVNKEYLNLIGEDQENTVIDGQKRANVLQVTADGVSISGFTIRNSRSSLSYAGIFVMGAQGIMISEVMTLDNYHGIFLYNTVFATLRNNNMAHNKYDFGIDGDDLADFVHDIDASNTVKDKPIYYWVNQHNKQVPSDAGFVAVVNSTDIIVRDLNLTENLEGVLFAYTTKSFMENVNASDNYVGTYLAYSKNNTVQGNNATNNQVGIYLYESESNNVNANTVMNNEDGIALYYSKDSKVNFNKLLKNDFGLLIEKSNNNTVNGNEASNNTYGLILEKSSDSTLKDNNMTSNQYNFGVLGGHLVHFIHDIDPSNTVDDRYIYYLVNQKNFIVDPSVFPNLGYLGIVNSTNISVKDLAVSKNVQGILFAYTNSSTVANISVTGNFWGIFIVGSSLNIISGDTLADNQYSIDLLYSQHNTIHGNNVTTGLDGIFLGYSISNLIVANNVTLNRRHGIWLVGSDSNSVSSNVITSNRYGIELHSSGSSILKDNNMTNNNYNFGVQGELLSHFIQDIDTSNTVEGKIIYYLVNKHGEQVPADAGYVAVVNSTHVTVANLDITNNVQGILFAYTVNSRVNGNNIAKSDVSGIDLYCSDDNNICGNTVTDGAFGLRLVRSLNNSVGSNMVLRSLTGIYLEYSEDNIVFNNKVVGASFSVGGIVLSRAKNNTISGNEVTNYTFLIGAGIYLELSSNNNTIVQNTLESNQYGITLGYLAWLYGFDDQNNDNTIHHNNFIENTQQVLSYNSINTWDDDYPSGGNYWSDYGGVDADGDGIGDTPYIIDADNQDRYPLAKPWSLHVGDFDGDFDVDADDIRYFAQAYLKYWLGQGTDPVCDFDGDGDVDYLDVVTFVWDYITYWKS